MAGYYQRRFNVDLDPESEIIATLGSKEGLANLAQAITSPGDVILAPNPSYPIHAFGFIIAGGSVRHLPAYAATPENRAAFIAALERAVVRSIPKPLAVVINFPSNPTAEVVSLDFLEEIVDFCRRQEIWILSDLARSERIQISWRRQKSTISSRKSSDTTSAVGLEGKLITTARGLGIERTTARSSAAMKAARFSGVAA